MRLKKIADAAVQKPNIFRITLITTCILLAPLVAMQFSDDVVWGFIDFILMGTLLFGAELMYEFGIKKVHGGKYRAILGVGLVLALLLVWVELAVGIFD